MKQLRKIFAIIAVFAIILTTSMTAFAATGSNIVVSGAKAGETYKLYKLFDATQSEDATKIVYTISKDSPWKSIVEAYTYNESNMFSLVASDDNTFIVVADDSFNDTAAADFSAYLKENMGTVTPDATVTADNNGSAEFTGLDIGYYFVTTSLGALCSIDTNNQTVAIREKNSYPSIVKKIIEGENEVDETSASIGDTVKYKLTVTDGTGTDKKLTVHDKMEAGLTLDTASFEIKADDTAVATTNYTVKTEAVADGCTFEIEFTPTYIASLDTGKQIVITFEAVLNSQAEIFADTNDNTAWLTYGDVYKSEEDTVIVKTYKFDVVKTTSDGAFLTGAEFKLYDAKTGGNEITLIKDNGTYRPAVQSEQGEAIIVDGNGLASIKGLASGEYYLEETKAPTGYNPLTERVAVTITDANVVFTDNNGNNAYDAGEGGIRVINNTGVELPSTGGIGTTLFVVLGVIAVLGAGLFLVVNKRMSKEAL